jgi:predicted metal-dependent HD superfamily phosphohydrolase
MRQRWLELTDALGSPRAAAESAFADLAGRYAESARAYHDLDHIRAVLDSVESLWPGPPPALALAAWLHDVIYDPRAADNEERSAAHARSLAGPLAWPGWAVEEAARLILLTRTHRCDPDDRAGRVLLDADLAVLGAAPEDYDRYARAIRREYAWVDEAAYRAGRARVLEGFLARPRLFLTDEFFRAREAAARENLRREVEGLRD